MSYNINITDIISFLNMRLKLPRFQRKSTWNKKQNFELAISIFQDYPIGVAIINDERDTSWLLDGRQRRNALTFMRDNPVELYEWARNYIKFKKTTEARDVEELYWEKVEGYLQTEEEEPSEDDQDGEDECGSEEKSPFEDDQDSEDEYGFDDSDNNESCAGRMDAKSSFDNYKQRQGLKTLLDMILMVHPKNSSGGGWEQIFDFRKYFSRLEYASSKNDGKISPVKLRNFIIRLNKDIEDDGGDFTKESFVDYYKDKFTFIDEKKAEKFKKAVEGDWNNISKSVDIILRSERVFTNAKIAIIHLTNATSLDAQNIFSRINKGGTQLKAEELLSAKPFWNREVTIDDSALKDIIKDMYEKLEIPCPDTIVRWDLAATLISRIQNKNFIFGREKQTSKISMEEISMGFQLLSAVYQGGTSSRKHIPELEKNTTIKWDRDIDELIGDFNIIFNNLLQDSFFQCLQSWKKSMLDLLTKATVLEFATILWLDWKEKEASKDSESRNMKALIRDARILFDRLVFEYATNTWDASGHSKMSRDVEDWKSRIVPISSNDWKKFINGACNGNYNGRPMTVRLLCPVLYYYYIITRSIPINEVSVTFDVDHIIPQQLFDKNPAIDQTFKDSLVNLALLPTKSNISKKAKRLNEITDDWLKTQITTYTKIEETDFQKYSDLTNLEELRKERANLFAAAFGKDREALLAN